MNKTCKIIKVKKKTPGEFRTIYSPNEEYKANLRNINGELNQKVLNLSRGQVHGFLPRHSPVTNATKHIGFAYTLNMDLADFFDSVEDAKVEHLTKEEKEMVFVDGFARQGLPTSPAVANLAALKIDAAILKLAKKQGWNKEFVYTRYADDLSFSFNDFGIYQILLEKIPQICSRCGFKIKTSKTRLQDARFGLREITGIKVGHESISAPRRIKRKLRAAEHQKNESSALGLREFSKLKLPREEPKKDLENFLLNFGCEEKIEVPERSDTILTFDCKITGDPFYILGCTSYATNWTSCYALVAGCNRRAPIHLVQIKGVRIAVFTSENTKKVGGVKHKRLRARTFVYKCKDGREYYGQVYGENQEAKNYLTNLLDKAGISCYTKSPNRNRVEGSYREVFETNTVFYGFSRKIKLKDGKNKIST